jgi:hypothetical protein
MAIGDLLKTEHVITESDGQMFSKIFEDTFGGGLKDSLKRFVP